MKCFPWLGGGTDAVFAGDFLKYGRLYLVSLTASVLFCTGIPKVLYQRYKNTVWTALGLTGGILGLYLLHVYGNG